MENTAGGEADFHECADAEEEHARQSGIKNGKLDPGQGIQPHQPPIRCPECMSRRLWKDGLRYLNDGRVVQRWLCRNCGLRFSESATQCQVKLHVPSEILEVESRNEERVADATLKPDADIRGKIVEYLWYLKKQGYASATVGNYVRILEILHNEGANLLDPESVKEVIALKEDWGKGRKWNAVKAYSLFLKMQGLKWEKPRYKPVDKLPFIPTEREIDDLIAGCSKQISVFLQLLKETGARLGEAFALKWTDIDTINRTVRITPEKGSEPRIFRMRARPASPSLNTLTCKNA